MAVLQFWGDKASTADGIVYGGHERPVSALAEYVLNTINPGLDPRSKLTWDDVVTQTPWMAKLLHGMTAAQEMTVRCQALPVPGESSELEVILEKDTPSNCCIPKEGGSSLLRIPLIRSQARHLMPPPGLTKVGRGDTLKLHLKRARGEGWSVETRDSDPSVGHPVPDPTGNQTAGK